ncbi:MAG: T9SS type A sorting domain-containing protein [Bacteroidota bacterium]
MKKVITCIISFFLIAFVSTQAQSTLRPGSGTSKKGSNFFEMRDAMNKYFSEHPEEMRIAGHEDESKPEFEDGAYEKFKRWEYYWQTRISSTGEFVSPLINLNEWKAYNDRTFAFKEAEQGEVMLANWIAKGPDNTPGGYYGIGRINCIAFHPTNTNTFWVGTAAGGLWKTTNGGSSWSASTINGVVLGVSDIAVNPSNPNTIYIATGDGESGSLSGFVGGISGSGDSKSIGVLKSTDGGSTWSTTGLTWTVQNQLVTHRLLINPNNPQILLLAASDGVYKTTNGGTSWTQIASGADVRDLEFRPGDPNTVYAATFDQANANAQVYTSIDGGDSFNQTSFFNGASRINMAVTPAWPDLVDCLIANQQSGLLGLFASTDAGQSFTEYFTADCTNNLLNGKEDASGCDGQGNYDLAYAINPSDENEIWIGAVNLWKTSDGGGNWNLANYWYDQQNPPGVPVVHADKHFLAFDPQNSSTLYQCNDGGLYKTANGGTTWTVASNGIQNSEMYRISVAQSQQDVVLCGLQDNGNKLLANNTWIETRSGGDGLDCAIDYTNPNIQYSTYPQGGISRTTDGWATSASISANLPGQPSGSWLTPVLIDNNNPQIIYTALDKVYKSNDRGDTWQAISNVFTGHPFYHLAVAASNSQSIAASTFDSLFLTNDGGNSWGLVTFSQPGTYISNIAYHTANPQIIYITLSGYVSGEKVYRSTDDGNNWSNISGSLPNVPVNCIVQEAGGSTVYIGTDLGVWYRNDNTSDWIPFNTNLPTVPVTDLEIYYTNPHNQLWAGTFGRGLWRTDSWVGIDDAESVSNSFTIFPNPASREFEVIVKNPLLAVKQINILNELGEIVVTYDKPVKENSKISLDIDGLANGVYVVQIVTNQIPVLKKLVVSK